MLCQVRLSSLWVLGVIGMIGCGSDGSSKLSIGTDGGGDHEHDDGGGVPNLDASQLGIDAGLDATARADGSQSTTDAGCTADAGCDPLAPFALDCAKLPTGGACQGGPREVLLTMSAEGLIAMFDPGDGHFLGYLKRPGIDHFNSSSDDYWHATQGPDQCIWTVGETAGVQRWNTDGTLKDAPLHPMYVPVTGQPDELAIQSPHALAFSADKVFVASSYGSPHPRLTRWNLDGTFDKVALADGTDVRSLLVLGNGSLLLADGETSRVVSIPANGGPATPVLGELQSPSQISYFGNGKVLVSDVLAGEPDYQVEIATGLRTKVYPHTDSATQKSGIAPLRNGRWLITGGDFEVAALDPASTNPTGQWTKLWSHDPAFESITFKFVGRACLPTAVVDAHAPKPANDTCIDPPAGTALLDQGFSSGLGGFSSSSSPAVSVVAEGYTGPTGSSLQLLGGNGQAGTGTKLALPHIKPTYVRYFVKVNDNSSAFANNQMFIGLGAFSLEGANGDALLGTYITNGYLNAYNAYINDDNTPAVAANTWIRIELRNIDWTLRTYDLYVDCKRRAEGIQIPPGYGDDIVQLRLNNSNPLSGTRASFFDDILIK